MGSTASIPWSPLTAKDHRRRGPCDLNLDLSCGASSDAQHVSTQPRLVPDPFGLVGQTLAGRFRVERQIAEGGFGVVYRAQQIVLERSVALKVLKVPADLDGK